MTDAIEGHALLASEEEINAVLPCCVKWLTVCCIVNVALRQPMNIEHSYIQTAAHV